MVSSITARGFVSRAVAVIKHCAVEIPQKFPHISVKRVRLRDEASHERTPGLQGPPEPGVRSLLAGGMADWATTRQLAPPKYRNEPVVTTETLSEMTCPGAARLSLAGPLQ